MQVDCGFAERFLSVLWLVVGVLIAGPIGFAIGRRGQSKGELTYRGPGGGQR